MLNNTYMSNYKQHHNLPSLCKIDFNVPQNWFRAFEPQNQLEHHFTTRSKRFGWPLQRHIHKLLFPAKRVFWAQCYCLLGLYLHSQRRSRKILIKTKKRNWKLITIVWEHLIDYIKLLIGFHYHQYNEQIKKCICNR